jgi:hypothetical protein
MVDDFRRKRVGKVPWDGQCFMGRDTVREIRVWSGTQRKSGTPKRAAKDRDEFIAL